MASKPSIPTRNVSPHWKTLLSSSLLVLGVPNSIADKSTLPFSMPSAQLSRLPPSHFAHFFFFLCAHSQSCMPKPNKRRRHSRRAHASKKRKERVMEESTRSRIWLLSRDQEPKWPFKDIGREDARSSSFLLFAPIFVERSSLWIELKAPLD